MDINSTFFRSFFRRILNLHIVRLCFISLLPILSHPSPSPSNETFINDSTVANFHFWNGTRFASWICGLHLFFFFVKNLFFCPHQMYKVRKPSPLFFRCFLSWTFWPGLKCHPMSLGAKFPDARKVQQGVKYLRIMVILQCLGSLCRPTDDETRRGRNSTPRSG